MKSLEVIPLNAICADTTVPSYEALFGPSSCSGLFLKSTINSLSLIVTST